VLKVRFVHDLFSSLSRQLLKLSASAMINYHKLGLPL